MRGLPPPKPPKARRQSTFAAQVRVNAPAPDLSGYATTGYVDSAVDAATDGGTWHLIGDTGQPGWISGWENY